MKKQKKAQNSLNLHVQKIIGFMKRNRKQTIAGFAVVLIASSFIVTPLLGDASATPTPTGYPSPSDAVATPYGSIGKWMIKSNGEVADYGGQKYQGKKLLEAINVIIVDSASKSVSESKAKMNKAMSTAGFPARFGHSGGFKGLISGVQYKQLPSTLLTAYSDKSFLAVNNHGRLFGPSPVNGGGYVYSGAFSTEKFATYNYIPAHVYVSSNKARNALAAKMTAVGQTQLPSIDMSNAYNTVDTTVGDHDGMAAVVVLK